MTLKLQPNVFMKKEIQVQKLPEVDLGNQGLDPKNWAERVVASAKNKQAQSGPTLQVMAPVADVGLLKESLLSPAEKLIREAKLLIKDKKFKDARAVLAKAQKTDPDLLMAPILDGFCCYRLQDDWAALECLRPAHGQPMDEATGKYYVQVVELVRKRMLPAVVDECAAQFNNKNYQPAIDTLKRAVALDPTVTVYHSLYADGLLLTGQLEQALAAVDAGLAVCQRDETEDLQNLRDHILMQFASTAMQPAVESYRKNDFNKARTILAGLAPAIKGLPIWQTFDRYLCSLTGWFFNKKITQIVPSGTPEEVESLYNLLVGKEIAIARIMLLLQQFDRAVDSLEQAHKFAPRCAYLQFLRGVCIYQHMGHKVATGNHPPIEDVCYRLQDARAHATVAIDLGYEPAREFLKVLQQILKPMEDVVAPPGEAKLINEMVGQFVAAVKLGENGISSMKHLDTVYNAIQAAGKQIVKHRSRVRSKSAIETLDDLTQAVKSHCQQLDTLRRDFKEGDIIEKHFLAFKNKMDSLQKHPIANRTELNDARKFFQGLKKQIEIDRRTLHNEQLKTESGKLLQAVTQILQQLETP